MSLHKPSPILLLSLVALLAGCASKQPAPVTERVAVPSASAPTAGVAATAVPSPPLREVDPRPEHYLVKRGDTLYSIALEHGLDYRELAALNNIENANVIRVGQLLRVRPAGAAPVLVMPLAPGRDGSTTAPMAPMEPIAAPRPLTPPEGVPPASGSEGVLKTQPKAIRLPYSEQALAQVTKAVASPFAGASKKEALPEVRPGPKPEMTPQARPEPILAVKPEAKPEMKPEPRAEIRPESKPEVRPEAKPEVKPEVVASAAVAADDPDKIEWLWPTQGKIVGTFNENANLKGLDIGGKLGQPIMASAAGRVVYAGSGLRGYGKLIIIKHNKTYLSAYAHNKEILVKEGDNVNRGQKIAELGNSDTDQPKLHFEIRRFGKPVDPVRHLPTVPNS